MAFYFVDQPFLAMESAFPSPRFCRQQRSPCHQRRQQCRRMPSYANSMDQLMEEARRQVLLEQNRTSEALAMQNFLGVMNGIVESFFKEENQTEVEGEKKSNSKNENSASASKGESNPDKQPKNDDNKESDSKQKCSHPGALKDYFAAIDAIVNAMSGKNQQKTGEDENSNQSENVTTTAEKNADQSKKNEDTDEEQNNNNFGEEKQPMKDFLNVMDTIVGKLMTHHHNENSISSEEKNLCQTEVVVDKLSAGGNADDNNVDQAIKIKTPTEAEKDEPPKKEQVFNSTENEVAQEVLKSLPRSSIQQVSQQQKRLLTQVYVDENLDRVQIQIEFSGYDLKPEDLDVQVVNNNILLVKAEKNDQKIFERKFKLPAKCQLDNIQPKFNAGDAADENSEQEEDSNITQTLNILVPKVDVKKTVNIPINTTTSTTEE